MRVRAAISLALLAILAASGCGRQADKPPLTIAIVSPKAGPLASRAADMRRAATLELDAIHSRAAGHRLSLVFAPSSEAVASIVLPGASETRRTGQLRITLTPPQKRLLRATGTTTIALIPPIETAQRVTQDYRESGAQGAQNAVTDNPETPGTPRGRYVTAALSEHSLPPAGSAFFKKFADQYGRAPDRWAIYAYEAVGLVIDAIARLEQDGAAVTRQNVAKKALSIRNRFGPVGHYDILPSGQSTLYVFQARGAGQDEDDPASLFESRR
jgi:ABC-type branched-subunit amino acid transport system substrate-binding protein